jgi:hypothetical protein
MNSFSVLKNQLQLSVLFTLILKLLLSSKSTKKLVFKVLQVIVKLVLSSSHDQVAKV